MSQIAVVRLPESDWIDLYAMPEVIAIGITPGTAIVIQNIDESYIYMQYQPSMPDVNALGELLTNVDKNYAFRTIAAGENNVWVRAKNDGGNARLTVRPDVN